MSFATPVFALALLALAFPPAHAQEQFLWGYGGSNEGNNIGRAIAADPDGRVYVGGRFDDTLDLDGDSVADVVAHGPTDPFNSGSDALLAAYDADGTLLWSYAIGSDEDEAFDQVEDLVVGPDGNLYAAGSSEGAVDFDADGSPDVVGDFSINSFVASYTPDGALRWVREVRGDVENNGESVAIAPDGRVLLLGELFSPVDFDGDGEPDLTPTQNAEAGYLASYAPDGTFEWARLLESQGFDSFYTNAVGVGADGAIYVTGYFEGEADFDEDGEADATSSGQTDVYVAAFDAEGTFQWVRATGSPENDFTFDLDVGPDGAVWVAGSFRGPVDFDGDGEVDTTATAEDLFLTTYDTDGTLLGLRTLGGSGDDRGTSVAIADDGSVYLAGFYESTVDFDGDGIADATATGSPDAFVAVYAPDATLRTLHTPRSPIFAIAHAVAIGPTGEAYATGSFVSSIDLDDDGTTDATGPINQDYFVVAYGAPSVGTEGSAEPEHAVLSPAYPNPLRQTARLLLTLTASQPVRVEVYDVRGRRVAVLHDGPAPAGILPLSLDATTFPAGAYVVRAAGETFTAVRRVTVVR